MLVSLAAWAALQTASIANPVENNPEAVLGQWKGIDVYQDRASYDGKTIYLPNNEEIIIEKNRVRVYFYPYFKSDEFVAGISAKSIMYTISKKKVKSDYSFHGDTLILSMNFINKTFVKMYERTTLDNAVIAELDQYGFNPSAIEQEFELDTLHKELRKGFTHFDSLGFEPIRFIQYVGDNSIKLERGAASPTERGYQNVSYTHDGVAGHFRVHSMSGTQQFAIIPSSLCQCDSIILPYIVVSWADRIRKQIAEDTW